MMTTRTEMADRAARKIQEILPHAMRAMMAHLRQVNPLAVPAHYRLLGVLAYHTWTLGDLADRLGVSPPTMSKMVTTLEERGWVARTRSSRDRRVVYVQATDEGKQVLHEMHREIHGWLVSRLEVLAAAEQETLIAGLEVLQQAFESALPGCPADEDDAPGRAIEYP